MTAKKKTAEPTYRWDGPPKWVPGWGHLEPGMILKQSELPPGSHPLLTPLEEEQHE